LYRSNTFSGRDTGGESKQWQSLLVYQGQVANPLPERLTLPVTLPEASKESNMWGEAPGLSNRKQGQEPSGKVHGVRTNYGGGRRSKNQQHENQSLQV